MTYPFIVQCTCIKMYNKKDHSEDLSSLLLKFKFDSSLNHKNLKFTSYQYVTATE